MNKEINFTKEKQELTQELVHLEEEEKRLETVINCQTQREEIKIRKKTINERLLEIHINWLKEASHEQK